MEIPRTVDIEIVFNRIGIIDIINEFFQAEINIESSWIDDQVFEKYDPDKNWNPKLYIKNIITTNKEDIKYFVTKDDSNNTVVTQRMTVKGKILLYTFEFLIWKIQRSYEEAEKIKKENTNLYD